MGPRQRIVDFGRGGRNLEETGYRGDSGVLRMIMLPAYPCTPGRIRPPKKLTLLRRGLTVVSSPDPPSGDEHECRGKSEL